MPTISHPATGSDGQKYTVLEITSTIRTTNMTSDAEEHISGLPTYRLNNLDALNKIGEGVFQTLDGRLTVTLDKK